MTAIVLGIASAVFLGGGLVLTQFGLRYIHPLSGAAISVPSFTIVFILLSPILLHGQSIEWRAVPIFAAVGLVFPAVLTILTFASNRALGPVVTGALGITEMALGLAGIPHKKGGTQAAIDYLASSFSGGAKVAAE